MSFFALRNLMIPLVEVDDLSSIHFADHIIYKGASVCLMVWAEQSILERPMRLLARV